MDRVVGIVWLLALLVLMGRGVPARRWPVLLLVTAAVVFLVIGAETAGWWPDALHTQ